jgi:hypothetical protein
MVVFKNPRDVSQIMALAHQMYPQRTKYFLEAYTAATAQPHGYMVIDMKQSFSLGSKLSKSGNPC